VRRTGYGDRTDGERSAAGRGALVGSRARRLRRGLRRALRVRVSARLQAARRPAGGRGPRAGGVHASVPALASPRPSSGVGPARGPRARRRSGDAVNLFDDLADPLGPPEGDALSRVLAAARRRRAARRSAAAFAGVIAVVAIAASANALRGSGPGSRGVHVANE